MHFNASIAMCHTSNLQTLSWAELATIESMFHLHILPHVCGGNTDVRHEKKTLRLKGQMRFVFLLQSFRSPVLKFWCHLLTFDKCFWQKKSACAGSWCVYWYEICIFDLLGVALCFWSCSHLVAFLSQYIHRDLKTVVLEWDHWCSHLIGPVLVQSEGQNVQLRKSMNNFTNNLPRKITSAVGPIFQVFALVLPLQC